MLTCHSQKRIRVWQKQWEGEEEERDTMSKGEIIHLLLLLPKPLNYTVIQNYGITLLESNYYGLIFRLTQFEIIILKLYPHNGTFDSAFWISVCCILNCIFLKSMLLRFRFDWNSTLKQNNKIYDKYLLLG